MHFDEFDPVVADAAAAAVLVGAEEETGCGTLFELREAARIKDRETFPIMPNAGKGVSGIGMYWLGTRGCAPRQELLAAGGKGPKPSDAWSGSDGSGSWVSSASRSRCSQRARTGCTQPLNVRVLNVRTRLLANHFYERSTIVMQSSIAQS